MDLAQVWTPNREVIAKAIGQSGAASEMYISAIKLLAIDIEMALTHDRHEWQNRRDNADEMYKRLSEIVKAVENEAAKIESVELVDDRRDGADPDDSWPWHSEWLHYVKRVLSECEEPRF